MLRDSLVGIPTPHGLDGLGIESRLERDIRHSPRHTLEPIQPSVQRVQYHFRGVKRSGRGVNLPRHLAARLKKE